ncbi:DUF4124 domain-containing protein [Psychromonas antarctica]|jgi:hypothetical protein|uniref:DUF4124 domain-containing protein n=1 Tax=Psychromonas antarctica TaxID=67573 RepID=UPI001EE895FC|nr:DUF4124 domain-containing protein [Psychromonas antarctica]MCG6200206.1 DUF4124 domain-containing protein [Psychromonas antarctica]
MKRFTLCLSALIFIFSSATALADTKIYHWVDEQGKSYFSDTAPPGAKEISISHQNLLLHSQVTKPKKDTPTALDQLQKTAIEYQATITSPLDDVALRSNAGTINIQVSTTPEKKNNQKLQLFLDGKALGEPQISPSISAQNIDRGTHQLQVQLLDEDGALLTKTQIVTVHLQRVAVGNLQ